jgi:hypothetical protein
MKITAFLKVVARRPNPLDLRDTPVHEKLDSINVAALIGDKEQDCAGNLVGGANPSERGRVALSFEEYVHLSRAEPELVVPWSRDGS